MRRSSRARGAQPTSAPLNQTGSSSSSASSARIDRATRSNIRPDSPNKSSTPRSSSEDNEAGSREPSEPEARQTRQKRREQEVQDDGQVGEVVDKEEEEEPVEEDEEEITRCVCRKQDYPGPPIPLGEASRTHSTRDNQAPPSSTSLDGLSEDAGSLFIQCDGCHVWQHGGCVGIMDEAMSPDKYYCEECRKDLHKIMTGARGQRYSRYLPVLEKTVAKPSRKPPIPPKDPDSRSPNGVENKSRAAAAAAAAAVSSAKRRSTMNSRAALDEEEALRKAIEESKSDGSGALSGSGHRKGKRLREGSEELNLDLKRRRTGSQSDTPSNADLGSPPPMLEGDEKSIKFRNGTLVKRSRAVGPPTQRDKESRDRERDRDRERAEAAGRRKGRADRRHPDEEEQADEEAANAGAKAGISKPRPQSSKTATGTPLIVPSTSHKKGSKTAVRRRVGRNQYTRNRETAPEKTDSPRASRSRDSDDMGNGATEAQIGGFQGNGSKPSKPRHMNPNRTTLNDLRKRAAGILEFISQTQIEMAGEKTPPSYPAVESKADTAGKLATNSTNSKLSNEVNPSVEMEDAGQAEEKVGRVEETAFKQMSSLQMMDVLTRELVLWQREHGKYSRSEK